jgi:hypothetical protein
MEDFSRRVLDRLPEFDERSRLFRAIEPTDTRVFRSYTWSCGIYNDQGYEGACVGFAWSHELSARPKVIPTYTPTAQAIYERARFLDEWEGEDYDGTSVLAGVKAVQEMRNSYGKPLIQQYRWGFGVQDVLRILGYQGPVVLGINWYEQMFYPDTTGLIKADGEVAGGHAILANGVKIVKVRPLETAAWDNVDKDLSIVRLHNSWGTSYGKGGDVFVSVADLDYLLQNDGEACIPTIRSVA